jgi:biopolymer transport protein ExbB/TolQ
MKRSLFLALALFFFIKLAFSQDWQIIYVKEKSLEIMKAQELIVTTHQNIKNYSSDVATLVKNYNNAVITSTFEKILNPNSKNFKDGRSFTDIIIEKAKSNFTPGDNSVNDVNFNRALKNVSQSNSVFDVISSLSPVVGIVSNVLSVVNNFISVSKSGFTTKIETANRSSDKMLDFIQSIAPYISFYDKLNTINNDWQYALKQIQIDIEKNTNNLSTLKDEYLQMISNMKISEKSRTQEIINAYGFSHYTATITPDLYQEFKDNQIIQRAYIKLGQIQQINEETEALLKKFDQMQVQNYERWIAALNDFQSQGAASAEFSNDLKAIEVAAKQIRDVIDNQRMAEIQAGNGLSNFHINLSGFIKKHNDLESLKPMKTISK